ncbi:MAG: Tol-Pal system protein TolB [Alphaproteobacteria bacterium]|nr:Tol-Pal system protein TolB [Alphaproteobacteria bacterium]
MSLAPAVHRRLWSALHGAALVLVCLAALATAPGEAAAELRIDITRGRVQPLPIAVPRFSGTSAQDAQTGGDIAGVIAADLERSGFFRPLDQRSFLQDPQSLRGTPRFQDWRVINAQALVTGTTERLADGRLKVEFRLWDVFAEQQMTGLAYFTQPTNWRRIAHIVADAIYKRITGEDGYFDTRIVYVAESGPGNARVKRLAIMDQDGFNHRFLTDGRSLVMTPRFSPTAQEITYLSFGQGQPRVYVLNIDTGRQEAVGDFPGMTFAPRFSPDGNKVIMSMSSDGNTEIYSMDLRSRSMQRLTNHPAIDTSPSYSPTGREIVFNSDRGGAQQLYVMSADGSGVRRISFGSGRYATPAWSPRGDLIAFTKIEGGKFSIGVMRPDGSGERLIADGFLVESPTWAPNGRVLMFFRQQASDRAGRGGGSKLFTIDLSGFNEREVLTPQDASDPAWSPLIP